MSKKLLLILTACSLLFISSQFAFTNHAQAEVTNFPGFKKKRAIRSGRGRKYRRRGVGKSYKRKGKRKYTRRKKGRRKGRRARRGRGTKSAPIYAAFMRHHRKCAPGCKPYAWGTWGRRASGRSCHHTGQAVDVGGLKCGRTKHMSPRGRFSKYVKCMVRSGKFRKLYKVKNHYDHVHFSYGCKQRRI